MAGVAGLIKTGLLPVLPLRAACWRCAVQIAVRNLPNLFTVRSCRTGNNPQKNPLKSGLFCEWLGWQDSNLRMPVPKTGALPLGYTPTGGENISQNFIKFKR